jgi:hypothetical protein
VTVWLPPFVVALFVAGTGLWVYADAQRCAAAGSPAYLKIGPVTIDTPVAWLVGCVVLWIFFFPVYLLSRSRD